MSYYPFMTVYMVLNKSNIITSCYKCNSLFKALSGNAERLLDLHRVYWQQCVCIKKTVLWYLQTDSPNYVLDVYFNYDTLESDSGVTSQTGDTWYPPWNTRPHFPGRSWRIKLYLPVFLLCLFPIWICIGWTNKCWTISRFHHLINNYLPIQNSNIFEMKPF